METNTHQSVGTGGPGLPGGPINPFKRSVLRGVASDGFDMPRSDSIRFSDGIATMRFETSGEELL